MKIVSCLILLLFCACPHLMAQDLKFEKARHILILNAIKSDIKNNYFDPTFRGIDLEARFKKAEEKLKTDMSIGQMAGTIAQVLTEFEDSHLFYVPPSKANKTKYGFEMQMIGDRCYAMRVHEKSDAFAKGLRIGDQILAVENAVPTRENLWLMNYLHRALRPKPALKLDIAKPDGKQQQFFIEAKITEGRRQINLATSSIDINNYIRESESAFEEAHRQFIFTSGNDLAVWQMPAFNLSQGELDSVMDDLKDKKALVIDLRNNGGGRVDMLQRLIGYLFDREIKIGDEKRRKESKPMIAKSRGKDIFKGKLAVLIDSESGSASEIFAKVIQLEKRGSIVGDRSAGAVMESRYFPHETGLDVVVFYGVSVTIADIIMTDGKSLENVGVIPDDVAIPTAADLAANRDPALAKALKSLGYEMSSEQAGAMFLKEKQKYKEEY